MFGQLGGQSFTTSVGGREKKWEWKEPATFVITTLSQPLYLKVLFCFVLFCFVLFCFVLFCFVFIQQLTTHSTAFLNGENDDGGWGYHSLVQPSP